MSESVWKSGASHSTSGRFDEGKRSGRVRLTRKLADCVDGIDLSRSREGDVLDLGPHEADLLIAEGWAQPIVESQPREVRGYSAPSDRAEAADTQQRTLNNRLWHIGEQIQQHEFEPHLHHRRMEDLLRDELHDARATTVGAIAHTSHSNRASEKPRSAGRHRTVSSQSERVAHRKKPPRRRR
jgi:hypothetical protein